MLRKRRLWILLLVLLVPLVSLLRTSRSGSTAPQCKFENRKAVSELNFTDHALCRMQCRNINSFWVEKVYRKGRVNCKKSGPVNGDMRWALELKDDRGDKLRVIIEEEAASHVVITAIRVGREDHCACS